MATLLQVKAKLEALRVDALADASVNATKEAFLDEQREQLLHGVNRFGEPIGEYKSEPYSLKKLALNPLPGLGVPDLKLTGAMYNELDMNAIDGKITITSKVAYYPYLEGPKGHNYGPEILGLGGEYKISYIQELQPVFIQLAKEQL